MKLKDLKDVLTFRAFRPEPDDSTALWRKRFPAERTLMLNIGRRRISWATMDKRGDFTDAAEAEGDLKEVIGQYGEEWKTRTDNGWCAVSLNHRFVITLEVNLSRRAGLEQQLKANPKAVLGAKAERGKRYNLTHNPESNSSILMAVDEEAITKTEAMLKDAGLFCGRISVGVYGMMLDLIEQVNEVRRARVTAGEALGNAILLTCCEGSVCVLSLKDEQWLELRSRADLYADDMTPVLEILTPLLLNAGSGAQVILMNDEPGSNFPDLLRSRAPGVQISDVSVPGQLWKLLTDQ